MTEILSNFYFSLLISPSSLKYSKMFMGAYTFFHNIFHFFLNLVPWGALRSRYLRNYTKAGENILRTQMDPFEFKSPLCETFSLCLYLLLVQVRVGRGDSACLLPMWPEYKPWTLRHKWVEWWFVVGCRPCSKDFSPGSPAYLHPQSQPSKFYFGLDVLTLYNKRKNALPCLMGK